MPRHPLGRLGVALVITTVVVASCGDRSTPSGSAADDPVTDTTVTDLDLLPLPDEEAPEGKPAVDVPPAPPLELVVTDLVDGTGRRAQSGDTVVVDYVGVRTADGAEFDNSWDRGVPFDVVLGQGRVITGWEQGLLGSRVGGRRQLDIPADLAYGDNPPGGSVIRAGDALTFVVDVRAVIAPVEPDDAPLDLDIATSSGATEVTVVDAVVGDGAEIEPGQTAIVHLLLRRGDTLEVLEDTWRRNDPVQIVLAEGQSIPGLVDGLAGMRVGGTRVITMPPESAFGTDGLPDAGLPAGTDVVIVVELVGSY